MPPSFSTFPEASTVYTHSKDLTDSHTCMPSYYLMTLIQIVSHTHRVAVTLSHTHIYTITEHYLHTLSHNIHTYGISKRGCGDGAGQLQTLGV